MALSEAKKRGIDPENILDLVLYGVPIALIGARSTMLFLNYHFI
jgi:hypothetical protein